MAVYILAQVLLLCVVSVVRHPPSCFAPFHLEVLVTFLFFNLRLPDLVLHGRELSLEFYYLILILRHLRQDDLCRRHVRLVH